VGEGGGHQVDTVHVPPDEGHFGTTGTGPDLQHGERAGVAREELQVEHRGTGQQRPGGGAGDLADPGEKREVVDLNRAERAARGEIEAGVQVARGPPGSQLLAGEDTVDVQDLVRHPWLDEHVGVTREDVAR
jgi:hypothetical protein